MADKPRRWRDIRVVADRTWLHTGPGAPQARYGGTITVRTQVVNGKTQTWVTESFTAKQQISSATKQAGHVTLVKTVGGAKTAGKLTVRTTTKVARASARAAVAQLRNLEAGGDLDVNDQAAAAAHSIAAGAGRSIKPTPKKKTGKKGAGAGRGGLTGGVRQVGAGLMSQVRTGVQLVGAGAQLDVERTAARTAQQAWRKSIGITGRASGKVAKKGARLAAKWAKYAGRRTGQWAAAKAAASGVKVGIGAVRIIGALVGAAGALVPVLALVVGIVTVLCAILPSFITGAGAEQQRRQIGAITCIASDTPTPVLTPEQVETFLPLPQGFDWSADLTTEQRATAASIVEVGMELSLPPQAWAIALMTALQESTLGADKSAIVPNTDVDVGVFQQRAKVGWYADGSTVEENVNILNDVRYAARTFYTGHDVAVEGPTPAGPIGYHIPGLVDIRDWESMDLGAAAQKVQVSAFPEAYAKHEATVAALLPTLSVECTTPTAGSSGLAGVDDYHPWWVSQGSPTSGYDDNGAGFAWKQCTSYAAFAVRTYTSHKDFTNSWKQPRNQKFGDAKTWHTAAARAGVRVDQTPAVGAVAQRTSGDWGHVAFVVAVNSDGSFVINEYNRNGTREFGSRTARIGPGSNDFTNILHFEEPL